MDSSQPRTDFREPTTSPQRVSGGGDAVSRPEAPSTQSQKKPLKPCCACPETKKIRDECIMREGEEGCQHLIEAHKACMRSLGFNI
jgi:cytochrome c oxidase assembly protein subunit 17